MFRGGKPSLVKLPRIVERIADRLHARDPGHDGLRRALRAAIAIPIAAIISRASSDTNPLANVAICSIVNTLSARSDCHRLTVGPDRREPHRFNQEQCGGRFTPADRG